MKRPWYHPLIRNARLVLPPSWFFIAYALLLMLAVWLDAFTTPERPRFGPPGSFGPPLRMTLAFLLGGAVVYGVFRVVCLHPAFRPAYRKWLAKTCWDNSQPLPLGPVSLTLADAVLLSLAGGLALDRVPTVSPCLPVLFFAVAYLLFVSFSLLLSGPRSYAYAILFGLSCTLIWGTQPGIGCAIALATYLVALPGLRRGLGLLMEPTRERDADGVVELDREFRQFSGRPEAGAAAERARRDPTQLGWPFGYLGPYRQRIRLLTFDAVCLSLLAGWLTACLMLLAKDLGGEGSPGEEAAHAFSFFMAGLVVIVLVSRMLHCFVNYRSPISLRGRLMTFRWLIPSYDQAFVAPLAGLAILFCIGRVALGAVGMPLIFGAAAVIAAALLVGLVPGPTSRDWILTSECRIVASKAMQPQR
jgi:hypothetical protein